MDPTTLEYIVQQVMKQSHMTRQEAEEHVIKVFTVKKEKEAKK